MKFKFAVFMGHEMPFMGYSLEIHGIFIKIWFIVIAFLPYVGPSSLKGQKAIYLMCGLLEATLSLSEKVPIVFFDILVFTSSFLTSTPLSPIHNLFSLKH